MTDPMLERCKAWRRTLNEGRQRLAEAYLRKRDPERFLKQYSQVVDGILQDMWSTLNLGEQAALVAVGGYGRGQLFPHSDIDLLFLLPSATETELNDTITRLIGLMWDSGLEVGHSVRTLPECLEEAANDITIETTLLENRFLAGDAALHQAVCTALAKQRDPLAFFEGKILEQQQRHNRYFGVTNNLEPNVKESLGGLRD
ncbi:MAG TPA: nucleotidyltransferase domain-containing protein, partial [Pseudogulbenkiania sp.]|nr:nucleotidyltransferase domain-containing protein [Pseudogulbenkiania sp.]